MNCPLLLYGEIRATVCPCTGGDHREHSSAVRLKIICNLKDLRFADWPLVVFCVDNDVVCPIHLPHEVPETRVRVVWEDPVPAVNRDPVS